MKPAEPANAGYVACGAAPGLQRWGSRMKMIMTAFFVAVLAGIAFAEEASVSTNTIAAFASRNFRYVAASDTQKKTLNGTIARLALVKQTKAQTRTIEAALLYLWETVNIAVIQTPRTCTEYRDFFWFSRLDTANPDDQTFRSGFAVKKGTGDIYRWEEEKPQPSVGGDGKPAPQR